MIQLDFYPPKTKDNMTFPLNIEVRLSFPSNHARARVCVCIHSFICISVQAQYLNLHEWFPATNQATSLSNEYIQITLKTESPKV